MAPLHQRMSEVHSQMEPVFSEMQKIHQQMEPVHERMQQVHVEMAPVLEQMQNFHLEMEPVHARMREVHGEMESLHVEMESLQKRVEASSQVLIEATLREELTELGLDDDTIAAVRATVLDTVGININHHHLRLHGSAPELGDEILGALRQRGVSHSALEESSRKAARALLALNVELDDDPEP
jgi:predicted nuclease with TOPRIM domain